MDEETFIAAARYDVGQTDPELVDHYERAVPFVHGYQGIARYWQKKRGEGA
jgi:hypothetical protein